MNFECSTVTREGVQRGVDPEPVAVRPGRAPHAGAGPGRSALGLRGEPTCRLCRLRPRADFAAPRESSPFASEHTAGPLPR